MATFRIAHFSDPHLGPLPAVRLRQLVSKRLTGYVNYRNNRVGTHDMAVLASLMGDMIAQAPDHICCTGDIANIGLVDEFATGAAFLDSLCAPSMMTFVPGNHDVYVRGSLAPMIRHLGPWMTGDDRPGCSFPFVRRFGDIAIVGLSSAVATLPFMASGTLGRAQREAAAIVLRDLGRDGAFRVVMIHHPPHRGGARAGRNLTDAAAFEQVLAQAGCELVLHGHNHKASLAWRPGPAGLIPILGAPSASASGVATGGRAADHRAGYHLIEIETLGAGRPPAMTVTTRGLLDTGALGDIARFRLADGRSTDLERASHPQPALEAIPDTGAA